MKERILAAGAFLILSCMPAAAFDYEQSVDEISISPMTAYDTVYLGMARADFDANFSAVPGWTFYGNHTDPTERAERISENKRSDVQEGIKIFTADASPASKILAFENYFKTADKGKARDIYKRLRATIYSAMEDFPQHQRAGAVTWVKDDVTIVVAFDERKDEQGMYTVVILRYNNQAVGKEYFTDSHVGLLT